jgi:hypothetical protein
MFKKIYFYKHKAKEIVSMNAIKENVHNRKMDELQDKK